MDKNKADPILSNPVWVSKLSYLVDITSHINDLNLKLQGKENRVVISIESSTDYEES